MTDEESFPGACARLGCVQAHTPRQLVLAAAHTLPPLRWRRASTPAGRSIEDLFSSFEHTPLASASLAQVHRATLRSTGQRVAVKVQHAGLRETCAADIATVSFLVHAVKAFFPRFDYTWLADEVRANLPKELDFANEVSGGGGKAASAGISATSPAAEDCRVPAAATTAAGLQLRGGSERLRAPPRCRRAHHRPRSQQHARADDELRGR